MPLAVHPTQKHSHVGVNPGKPVQSKPLSLPPAPTMWHWLLWHCEASEQAEPFGRFVGGGGGLGAQLQEYTPSSAPMPKGSCTEGLHSPKSLAAPEPVAAKP